MLEVLKTEHKVVGIKQMKRSLKEDLVLHVFYAADADPYVIGTALDEAREKKIPVSEVKSMAALGEACGISVGASIAAIVK